MSAYSVKTRHLRPRRPSDDSVALRVVSLSSLSAVIGSTSSEDVAKDRDVRRHVGLETRSISKSAAM